MPGRRIRYSPGGFYLHRELWWSWREIKTISFFWKLWTGFIARWRELSKCESPWFVVIFYGFYFYNAESAELLNYKFFLVMTLNINLSLLCSSFKWITHCLLPFYISLLFVMHSEQVVTPSTEQEPGMFHWGHETQSMLHSSSTDLSHRVLLRQEGSCFKYTVDYWEPSPCLHPTPHLCSSDS